ncbi:amino acid ABC transporter membrane protein 2 (PAAT family) [Dongia mobilis]|uniref:Amino acid ABC transporter membrane protein 2 (PAAT family) n=1 Tax=Dongia mobilis TaxID=578943 RepID=A0A4R6WVV6_9PROT|nr:ABC transporter permease subunit [Dongia mobilis]TDQ84164.1 amino acid ABC transporter membrane protein 2 (PAAT family) [Dongia mobilis]
MQFDPIYMLTEVIPQLLWGKTFWSTPIVITLTLTILSCVIGNLLALPVAVARVSPNPLLWMPAYLYILVMRGTPLLVQFFLIYYGVRAAIMGLPGMRETWLFPYLRDAYWWAVFALSINTAGYTAEILRGAIQAVPYGEIEAGKAFGMNKMQIFWRITLPRAIRICLPTMTGETILLLKATVLASTITVYEILGWANYIKQQTFRVYDTLIAAALLYVILVFILTRILYWLERRLNRDRLQPPPGAGRPDPALAGATGPA